MEALQEKLRTLRLVVALMTLGYLNSALAAGETDLLFQDDSILAITLTAPFRSLARDSSVEPEYRPAKLSYTSPAGNSHLFDIQVRPRGKSRRDRSVCTFPPLRLNLPSSELVGTVFENQKNLKLVTHCREAGFQKYVVKEYLTYKILNLLTPASFNVRLLEVTYVDNARNNKSKVRYGFFIEHKNRLAARLGLQTSDIAKINVAQLDPLPTNIAELFQYLVSNTDFSFVKGPEGESCCHNAVLFSTGTGLFLPVPYDFDQTGIVNPPNGRPAENLHQRNFYDRLYRGYCHEQSVLEEALLTTLTKRPAIEELVNAQVDLDENSKRKALQFIVSYYDIIGEDKRRARALKCRKPAKV